MSLKHGTRRITITLSTELVHKIDEIAGDLSRSELIAEMIRYAFADEKELKELNRRLKGGTK